MLPLTARTAPPCERPRTSNAPGSHHYSDLHSLVKASRPSESETLLRTIAEKDPTHIGARVLVDFLYLGRSAVSEAEDACELTQRNPLVAEHHRTLAFLYQALGKDGPAFQEYKKAVELEPGNLASYLSLIGLSRIVQDWKGVLAWSARSISTAITRC
jgi:hypothetical protein